MDAKIATAMLGEQFQLGSRGRDSLYVRPSGFQGELRSILNKGRHLPTTDYLKV